MAALGVLSTGMAVLVRRLVKQSRDMGELRGQIHRVAAEGLEWKRLAEDLSDGPLPHSAASGILLDLAGRAPADDR